MYSYLIHHGVKGQKWGVRRYQNSDGSLTAAGRRRYGMTKDKNTSYIGGKYGYIGAYKSDKKKILKDIKKEIKSDKELSGKEKRYYYKKSKSVVDDFLNEKYDMKVSKMSKDAKASTVAKLAVLEISDVPLFMMKKVLKTSPRSKRLYKLETDNKTGISTIYDNKGRVVTSSDNKSKSKKDYRKIKKAVDDQVLLKSLYPKNDSEREKTWNDVIQTNHSIRAANKAYLKEHAEERKRSKKQIAETYFNVKRS